VALTSKGPISVPAQLTVAAGLTAVTFKVTSQVVSEVTAAQVIASYGVFNTKSADLSVGRNVVSTVGMNPFDVVGGNASTGTVKLTGPAGPTGLTVSLNVKPDLWVCGPLPTVPPSVRIPAGSSAASFPVTTQPAVGSVHITANGAPGEFAYNSLFVAGPRLGDHALELPASIKGGTTVQAKLRTEGVAGPATCNNSHKLESSNTLYAQVLPSVAVSPGASMTMFPITTSAVATAQTVTIKVFDSYRSNYTTATMTITP
jgi:hypothetical protein